MMPYFSIKENEERFKKELESWLKTPYMHMQQIKGRGADCVLFLANAMVGAGIFRKIENKFYHRDWMFFGKEEVALNSFRENWQHLAKGLEFKEVEKFAPAMFGDFLGFAMYFQTCLTNHAAIIFDSEEEKIIHCIQRKGVVIEKFSDVMKLRLTKRFRLFLK